MVEKLTGAAACIPLRRSELTRQNQLWRLVRVSTFTGLGKVFGPVLPLEWILQRADQAFNDSSDGFCLPVPLVLSHLGDSLLINVPTAVLQLRLPDWIRIGKKRLHLSDYFLGNGDWGELAHQIVASPVYIEARELIVHGLDYHRTRAYAHYINKMQEGSPVTRNGIKLTTPALVEGYFERFVALFVSIQKHGVQRLTAVQRQALTSGHPSLLRERTKEWGEREIGVAIGANGEIFRLPGGQHRTAIAMVLGLAQVPVQVRLIHVNWLRKALSSANSTYVSAIHEGITGLFAMQGGTSRD